MATMSDNERFVRAAWILVVVCDGSYLGYPRGTVLVQDVIRHWFDFDSWSAAAEFTRKRQQEIADVKYEISLQRLILSSHESQEWHNPQDWEIDKAALQRTIARLQSAMTELTRGWKEESHGN